MAFLNETGLEHLWEKIVSKISDAISALNTTLSTALSEHIDNTGNPHKTTISQAMTAENLTSIPVAKGGTGATTVAAARNNLGLGNTSGAVPLANGGTGATTVAAARTNLGVSSTSEMNTAISTAIANAIDDEMSTTSTNAVQNKVVNTAITDLSGKYDSVSSDLSTFIDTTAPATYIKKSTIGAASGVVPLNSSSKIDSTYLPSFVDDVLEYSAKSNFPSTGETGKIYVDTSTNKTYRWGGSAYVEISASLALGTTSSTAYRGDLGAANATNIATLQSNFSDLSTTTNAHISNTSNPHSVTKSQVGLGNVDNYSYDTIQTKVLAAIPAITTTKINEICV